MKLITLLVLYTFLVSLKGLLKMTNIKCTSLDASFSDFDYCYIRVVNRSYHYISLKVKLLQLPVNNVTVTLDLRKRLSGYKPFLYNITFDACKFLKTKSNPIANYFYSFIEPYSNMNHTCPYNHDITVEKAGGPLIRNLTPNVLPMPEGSYAVFSTWSVNRIPRFQVEFYFTLS